jgi:hypothetical protein
VKTWIALLCVALMVCFTAGTAFAQRHGGGRGPGPGTGHGPGVGPRTDPTNTNEELAYLEGVIRTVKRGADNDSARIIVTRKGNSGKDAQATILVNAETQIFVGDDARKLEDLAVGDKVIAGYVKPKDGATPLAVIVRVIKDDKGSEKGGKKPADAGGKADPPAE